MGRPAGSRNKRSPSAPTARKGRQRLIARVKPTATLAFDPSLRDSKGHLKASVMASLDEAAKRVDNPRPKVIVRSDTEVSDTEYRDHLDREAEKIDERWWAIPAKDRPPFSEFLRRIK